jgi:four helix bundle protein
MERLPAQNFQDLIVWQKGHQFVLGVYRLSKSFPREELYGLTSQFRRAAISVPANIAEGFKKRGKPDKVRFMNIAEGSLEECRYYLILTGLGVWRFAGVTKAIRSSQQVARQLFVGD